MRKVVSMIMVAACCATSSAMVAAEGSPWYAGLGAGFSKSELEAGFEGNATELAAFSLDDRGSTWSIFGGYSFNDRLSAELGYTDLGETSAKGNVGDVILMNMKSDTGGFFASVVGQLELRPNLKALARVGVYRWETDTTLTATSFGSISTLSEDYSGTDLTFGVGIQYDWNDWSGRLEWQRYNNLDRIDYDTYQASLIYSF